MKQQFFLKFPFLVHNRGVTENHLSIHFGNRKYPFIFLYRLVDSPWPLPGSQDSGLFLPGLSNFTQELLIQPTPALIPDSPPNTPVSPATELSGVPPPSIAFHLGLQSLILCACPAGLFHGCRQNCHHPTPSRLSIVHSAALPSSRALSPHSPCLYLAVLILFQGLAQISFLS